MEFPVNLLRKKLLPEGLQSKIGDFQAKKTAISGSKISDYSSGFGVFRGGNRRFSIGNRPFPTLLPALSCQVTAAKLSTAGGL